MGLLVTALKKESHFRNISLLQQKSDNMFATIKSVNNLKLHKLNRFDVILPVALLDYVRNCRISPKNYVVF